MSGFPGLARKRHTLALGGREAPWALNMSLEAQLDPGPRVGRTSAAALSAARTVLILVSNPHRAGEIAFALQRLRLPAVAAESAIDALFWAEQEPPALSLVDLRAERSWSVVERLRAEGRAVIVVSDEPGKREGGRSRSAASKPSPRP